MNVVTSLRADLLESPLAARPTPWLSWSMGADRRGARQVSWRVRVSTTERSLKDRPDRWDSGIRGGIDAGIAYAGHALSPGERLHWDVEVTDDANNTMRSSTASFTVAMDGDTFGAQWITLPRPSDRHLDFRPAPYLRRVVDVPTHLRRATAYVSAAGIAEFFVNGKRSSAGRFAPGYTDYNHRVQFDTLDLTPVLRPGTNVLAAVVADGWYAGYLGWEERRAIWGTEPAFFCELHLEDEDRRTIIVSDDEWRGAFGGTLSAELYHGERFDARREPHGWSMPEFDDRHWRPAISVAGPRGRLVPRIGPPVRTAESLSPAEMHETAAGSIVFDFGQNVAGWARLRTSTPAGRIVSLRFAELLTEDGELYTENLVGARCTDTLISPGTAQYEWEPRFTYRGFRYAELTGATEAEIHEICAVVAGTAIPRVGEFSCSDATLNRLHEAILWTQRANAFEVPTDCPQRDERLAWLADAQIFARTGQFLFDTSGFLRKWCTDLADAQYPDGSVPVQAPEYIESSPWVDLDGSGVRAHAGWSDAAALVPWTLYRATGDKLTLREHLPLMTRWVDFATSRSVDGVWDPGHNDGFGDWLHLGPDTPRSVIATAYHARSAQVVAAAAAALGEAALADHYAAVARAAAEGFHRAFIDNSGYIAGDTQTAYALAVRFQLVAEDLAATMIERLRELIETTGYLTTGIHGTVHVLPVLSQGGHDELAYRLLQRVEWPSLGFYLARGATTIPERWDAMDAAGHLHPNPASNSFNHCALGALGEWLYESVGGIAADDEHPGYARTLIAPRPGGGLTWAQATRQTLYGEVACRWQRAGHHTEISVDVPANASAVVRVPVTGAHRVTEGDQQLSVADGITAIREAPDAVLVTVGAGRYTFGFGEEG